MLAATTFLFLLPPLTVFTFRFVSVLLNSLGHVDDHTGA